MNWINSHIISISLLGPVLTSFILMFLPLNRVAAIVLFVGAFGTFMATLHFLYHFEPGVSGLQFREFYSWIPEYGINFEFGIDGINLLFILLTSITFLYAVFSEWNSDNKNKKRRLLLLLLLEGVVLASFVSSNIMLFTILWEVAFVLLFFLFSSESLVLKSNAPMKMILHSSLGGALVLAAVVYMGVIHNQQVGNYSFAIKDLAQLSFALVEEKNLLLLLFSGIAVRIAFWPVHSWVVSLVRHSSFVLSSILAAVIVQLGLFFLLRFLYPLFFEAMIPINHVLVWVVVFGSVYSALIAWRQGNVRDIMAYITLYYISFSAVGFLSVAFLKHSIESLVGSLYLLFSLGLTTTALFFLLSLFEKRNDTGGMAFHRIAFRMPRFALIFFFLALNLMATPFLATFVGVFSMLYAAFMSDPFYGSCLVVVAFLAALFTSKLIYLVLFAKNKNEKKIHYRDLSGREAVAFMPLILLIFYMGISSTSFFSKIEPSVHGYLIESRGDG